MALNDGIFTKSFIIYWWFLHISVKVISPSAFSKVEAIKYNQQPTWYSHSCNNFQVTGKKKKGTHTATTPMSHYSQHSVNNVIAGNIMHLAISPHNIVSGPLSKGIWHYRCNPKTLVKFTKTKMTWVKKLFKEKATLQK